MAAQDGTTTGVATGLGLGEEVGVADTVGVGDWLARSDGDGLWCGVPPPEFEQAATAKTAMRAAILIPTGNWNDAWRADVTAGNIAGTASTITASVFGQ